MRVPEGWGHEKLGRISTAVTSGSRDWAQFYSESGSKFIRMTNLRLDGIYLKLDDMKYVDVKSDSADGKRTALAKGDILISITAELGKIGWIPENFGEAFINQHTALVRINQNKANSKFIAYLLSSKKMNAVINQLNDAGAKAGLNLPTIKALPLLLPPLPEQQKIAQILSTWDKAIEKLETLIAVKQKRKKALMQQLLTGKKRFAGFGGEWTEVRLGDLLKGKKCKGKIVTTNAEFKGLPYIGSTSFEGVFGLYSDSDEAITCTSTDILILWDGENAGKVTTNLTGVVSSTVVRCRLKANKANNQFIAYRLLKDNYKIRAIREGSGIPHMPGDFEHWYELQLPTIEEQQKIASVLTTADTEIQTHQKHLSALKEQKKGLMQQLLTGKKRVKVEAHV